MCTFLTNRGRKFTDQPSQALHRSEITEGAQEILRSLAMSRDACGPLHTPAWGLYLCPCFSAELTNHIVGTKTCWEDSLRKFGCCICVPHSPFVPLPKTHSCISPSSVRKTTMNRKKRLLIDSENVNPAWAPAMRYTGCSVSALCCVLANTQISTWSYSTVSQFIT